MLSDLLNFHPLRQHRRQALLSEPMPEAWRGYLEANIAHYAYLSPDERVRLEEDLRVFVEEKEWEAGGGHTLTDEMKVTIAAQACLLTLGWEEARRADLFPNVPTLIVYPQGYQVSARVRQGYVQDEDVSRRLGEAWSSDLPIVLSWHSAREGGIIPDDGHNVVLHEFAHKLDMIDGSADGVPRLSSAEAYDEWAATLSEEYAALRAAAAAGHHSLLDPYGATNEAEFFAVATEAFFEKAVRLRDDHPRLYAVLQEYYRQDTAARIEAAKEERSEDER